jgi:hypothetical protein
MQLVEILKRGGTSFFGLRDGFCLRHATYIAFFIRIHYFTPRKASVNFRPEYLAELFLLLSSLLQVTVPAVCAAKPAVEVVVAFLAGHLEVDKTEPISPDNGLLAFAANNLGLEFHNSPLKLVHYSHQDSLFHNLSRS